MNRTFFEFLQISCVHHYKVMEAWVKFRTEQSALKGGLLFSSYHVKVPTKTLMLLWGAASSTMCEICYDIEETIV